MNSLVVEDDFTSRVLLQEFLKKYGDVQIAVNGNEAVEAVKISMDEEKPFDLICLDIMMPRKDGQQALKEIRELEASMGTILSGGAKIVMTTALEDSDSVLSAFREQCDGYLVKPIHKKKLNEMLLKLKLI